MSITVKALWYIEGHLSGDLSLEEIADVAGVSRFHLSRAFARSMGHSLSVYIRARRLTEAAKALAAGAPDILTVAMNFGYGSHEAFTRAFHQHFGLAPESLRALASTDAVSLLEPIRMNSVSTQPLMPPRIVKAAPLKLFGLSQRCTTNAIIPALWDRFVPHIGHIQGQVGAVTFGVVYNVDENNHFDYLCGVEVRAFPSHPAEFTRLEVPEQSYAVFEHRDHISSIQHTWTLVWERGLKEAGCQPADAPILERYGEQFDGRTGLGGVELWVPVL
ncbi:MAG: AraC family transcriptional regulator [Acidobacteria bacterium]|nr:AraC family transcriptional regulator [Acidobacteriota bacterium]